ncbi:unnamed protein product [Adineta steineri]|uniref:Uncharacterized protein n=1 Tax=Adineta steineri TaxID=433720 RepID=A0A816CE99_9BILA|nr:unnamed protein product [Adineta steineri]CAF1623530.1 unnamed protein product [Adineta steineri]
MIAAPWYCDNCGRANGITRYTSRSHITHPNHTFQLVQQAGNVAYTPTWTVSSNPQWPSYYYTYQNQQQPSWKVTYEYKTI